MKTKTILMTAALSCIAFLGAAFGGIIEKTTTQSGVGNSRNEAVADAIQRGFLAANGGHFQGTQSAAEFQQSIVSVLNGETLEDSSHSGMISSREFEAATGGFFRGYDIISEQTLPDGQVIVKIKLTVLDYQDGLDQDSQGLERIVICPLRANQLQATFHVGHSAIERYELVGRFRDKLEASLIQSRQFAVISRRNLEEVNEEKAWLQSGEIDEKEQVVLGKVMGAGYVITGTLWDFDVASAGQEAYGRYREYLTGGQINVSCEVMSIATRRIIWKGEFSTRISEREANSFGDATGLMNHLLEMAATKIARDICLSIYPPTVINTDGTDVVINPRGSDMPMGSVYEVYKIGEPILDRRSGQVLGREEIFLGEVKIIRSDVGHCRGRIIRGSISEFDLQSDTECRAKPDLHQEDSKDEEEADDGTIWL